MKKWKFKCKNLKKSPEDRGLFELPWFFFFFSSLQVFVIGDVRSARVATRTSFASGHYVRFAVGHLEFILSVFTSLSTASTRIKEVAPLLHYVRESVTVHVQQPTYPSVTVTQWENPREMHHRNVDRSTRLYTFQEGNMIEMRRFCPELSNDAVVLFSTWNVTRLSLRGCPRD